MRRSAVVSLLAAAGMLLLAGCELKPIPIRFDVATNKTVSKAEFRVAAVTTSEGPGIEIRFRNCATADLTSTGSSGTERVHLHPAAYVADSTGKVFYANASPVYLVQPPGSAVYDTKTPTTDDLQRIVVPTAGAKGALTIYPGCTDHPDHVHGPVYQWGFTGCTTTTRSCETRTGGRSTYTASP